MDNNCNNNRLKVKFKTDAFKSGIGGMLKSFENSITNNNKNKFTELCNKILFETCKGLLDLKCDLNHNNEVPLKGLKTKVNCLLRSQGLFKNTKQNVSTVSSSVDAKTDISTDKNKSINRNRMPVVKIERLNLEDKNNHFQKNESKRKLSYELVDYKNTKQNLAVISSSVNGNTNTSSDTYKSINWSRMPIVRIERLNLEDKNNCFEKNESKRKLSNKLVDYKNTKQNAAAITSSVNANTDMRTDTNKSINWNRIPVVRIERMNLEDKNNCFEKNESKIKLSNDYKIVDYNNTNQNLTGISSSVNGYTDMSTDTNKSINWNRIPVVRIERLNLEEKNNCFEKNESKIKLSNDYKIVDYKNTNQNFTGISSSVNGNTDMSTDTNKSINLNRIPVVRIERLHLEEKNNCFEKNESKIKLSNDYKIVDYKNTKQNVVAISSSVNGNTDMSTDTNKSINWNRIPVVRIERLNLEEKNNFFEKNESKIKLSNELVNYKNTKKSVAEISSSDNGYTDISTDTNKSIYWNRMPVVKIERLNLEDKNNCFEKNESKRKLSNESVDFNPVVRLKRCDASTSAMFNKKLKTTNDVQNVAGTSNSIILNPVVAVNVMDVNNAHVSPKSNGKDENFTIQPFFDPISTDRLKTRQGCRICCTRTTRSGRRVHYTKRYHA